MTEPQPPVFQHPEGNVKSSERFNDLLKAELDRLNSKIKTAEDRARGNSAGIIGSAALVGLLRDPAQPLPLWALVLFALGVLVTLAYATAILFNRNTTAISSDWMWKERTKLWEQDRTYMEVMQLYQKGTIRSIESLEQLQDAKYKLLGQQNVAVAATLMLLVILLATVIT